MSEVPQSPEATQPNAPTAMEAFFTRQAANEGTEFFLDLPNGKATEHRIRIRGMDSDEFKVAQAASKRKLMEIAAKMDKAKFDEVDQDAERLKLLASLVISWTFKDAEGNPIPCTQDGIINLLKNAPAIAEQIDRIASNRKHFFRKG